MTAATTTTAPGRLVLADLIPASRTRDVALVLGSTAFLIVAGQVAVPLWFTPVPLSLATFAVLLSGATLGPVRAALSTTLYLALGVMGAPIFASQTSGWSFASFGYIVGYVLAAIAVGALARRHADRSVLTTFAAACLGSLLIYAAGLPWLMAFLDVDLATGLELGVYPFLAGDAIKALAAALLLPTAWKLVDRNG
ncbi:MAG: biotin transporter BioY [Acidimicrobiales bacterium]|nr:biotin transporter BioY [Acidimicrobiales bacterium]